jgi:hypothetical protein
MEFESLSDDDLLAEPRSAQQDIPNVHPDPETRRAAWQRVIDATPKLERRNALAPDQLD